MIHWQLVGFVSAVLLNAGIGKLVGGSAFYWQLRTALGIGGRPGRAMAISIPVGECLVGAAVLLPAPAGSAGLNAATAMFAIFAAYALWVAATGREVRCYCFGRDDGRIGWPTVLRNLLFLTAALAASAARPGRISGVQASVALAEGVAASVLAITSFQLYSMQKEAAAS